RSERQLVAERAVFARQVFRQPREQRRGERALLLHAPQNLERRPPRARDCAARALPATLRDARAPAHPNFSPALTREPLMKSRAPTRCLPSSWTSSSRSAVEPPHETLSASPRASIITPGRT